MKVIRASAMGMCFGVRKALQRVRALDPGGDTVLYGELVHNPEVNQRLIAQGWNILDEANRSPQVRESRAVITAHGVSDRELRTLIDSGKRIVDTTCPLVRLAHEKAIAYARAGWYVVVVGRKNHVEVKGLTGDLDLYSVVGKLEDVSEYPSDRIGVVCQTTTPPSLLLQLWGAIARANPGKQVQLTDTICLPTKARQNAVVALCRTGIDALVVVGGRNSNNSAQLAALAESLGTRAFRVESGADLQPEELSGMETVGLTAGTSALDETVDAVEGALEVLGRDRIMGKAS